MSSIEVQDLFKIFGPERKVGEAIERARQGAPLQEITQATGCTVAVKNVSFQIEGPQIFVIMGLSGSGKSTLLRCVNYLIRPTSGVVKVDDQDLGEMDNKAVRELRKEKMAMVFQHFGLLDHRDVLGNVGFGLELRGVPEAQRVEKAKEALDLVGLSEHAASHTKELSGGMQQRIGLARALATEAEILLMDEAFSALDPLIRTRMQNDFLELQEKMPKMVLFITHDLGEALRLGDRIAILKEGTIVQIDTPEQIILHPETDYVESFVENVDRSRVLTAGTTARAPDASTISADQGADRALNAMTEAGIGYLYVLDDGRVRGVLRRQDVEARRDDAATLNDLMAESPAAVHKCDHLLTVIAEAVAHDVPLPVVDDDGLLVGLLSKRRILEAIARIDGHD